MMHQSLARGMYIHHIQQQGACYVNESLLDLELFSKAGYTQVLVPMVLLTIL